MTAPPRIRATAQVLTLAHPAVDHTEPDGTTELADSTVQKFTLSATQVMASMAAAVTAALVGSRLGVAGTVIGAGLASVISVVGGAVIGHSILLTRKQVKRAVLQVRGTGQEGPAGGAAAAVDPSAATIVLPTAYRARKLGDDYTTVIPAVTRLDLQRASQGAQPGPGHAEPGRPRPTRPRRRVSTGVLLGVAASLAIFVSALGAVTVFETIKGSPLSGGESGGLSVLGGNGGNPVDLPATTTTAVVTEPSTVTQTVTSEVAASDVTASEVAASDASASDVTAPATTTQSQATQSSTTTTTSSPAPASSPAPSSQATAGASTTASAGPR